MNLHLSQQRNLIIVLAFLISPILLLAQRPFITTWKTDNEGELSNDNQIVFPVEGTYTYYWEDINNSNINGNGQGNNTEIITFPAPGMYRLEATPSGTTPFHFIRLRMGNTENDPLKLLTVEQWGDVEWSTMARAFYGADNLKVYATDTPNLSNVTDMSFMFSFTSIDSVPNMNNWDVSNVIYLRGIFRDASHFNEYIGDWDVSNVIDTQGMFNRAAHFNQPLENWDVSNVNDMSYMFGYTNHFNQPLENWDVSNVTNMSDMFSFASEFNQPIGNWDVSNVTNMSSMFFGASQFNQPIGNWDVSNVTDMRSMFWNAKEFNQSIGNWNVGNVTDMSLMFNGAFAFNHPIGNWNVSQVTNMLVMFGGAISFNQSLNNWDVRNVTNMGGMFAQATSFDHSLRDWKLNSILEKGQNNSNSLQGLFQYSGMSCENYSRTLQGWANNPDIAEYVTLTSDGIEYSPDVAPFRDYLIHERGWTIEEDTQGDCLLSIDVFNQSTSIDLYPNPSSNHITLNGLQGDEIINLYDIQGRLHQTILANTTEITIDISSLATGIYYCVIVNDRGQTEVKKLIKK